MRIITNETLYRRSTRAAFIANIGGMFLLVASVFVLFNAPERFGLYLLFLLAGVISVQVGSYFGRWNRRPDRALNRALKSLDGSYTLYHYRSPASHLLLGPSGLWILVPRHTRGTITYDAKRRRWRVKAKSFLARFGQEGIGRPVQEASMEAEALDRYFQKHWQGGNLHVQAALVFVDEETEVQGDAAPIPSVSIKKLKQMLLKSDSKGRLSREQVWQLGLSFEEKPR